MMSAWMPPDAKNKVYNILLPLMNELNGKLQFVASFGLDETTCKFQFLMYKRIIPQHFWEKASFNELFNNHHDLSTFMLLDNSCQYDTTVGIIKESESILLNDNMRMPCGEFKTKMYNNDIIKM